MVEIARTHPSLTDPDITLRSQIPYSDEETNPSRDSLFSGVFWEDAYGVGRFQKAHQSIGGPHGISKLDNRVFLKTCAPNRAPSTKTCRPSILDIRPTNPQRFRRSICEIIAHARPCGRTNGQTNGHVGRVCSTRIAFHNDRSLESNQEQAVPS